ncbi:hypothetical protein SLA2020_457470 [Shorea laevis]
MSGKYNYYEMKSIKTKKEIKKRVKDLQIMKLDVILDLLNSFGTTGFGGPKEPAELWRDGSPLQNASFGFWISGTCVRSLRFRHQ